MANLLTDLGVRNASPGATRREVPDGKVAGLYLVIQPQGAKSWAYRYRAAGKPRKLTLGRYPDVGIGTARNLAQRAAGEVAQGADPAAAKQVKRASERVAAARKDDLVESVVADFVTLYAKKKTRDWKETERLLKKDVVSAWRGRRLTEIGKPQVVKLLDGIIDRGAPVGANRTFAQLRKLCSWAVSRGIMNASPCDGMEAPSPEVERDRVLRPAEIALIWEAADSIPSPYGAIVRVLMLTAARRDEVAGMEWAEVNLDAREWVLPIAQEQKPPRARPTLFR